MGQNVVKAGAVRYRYTSIVTSAMLAAIATISYAAAQDELPVARMLCFVSETCPECQYVKENILPELEDGYGSQLEIRFLEIEDAANAELLFRLEEQFDVTSEQTETPVIFIGDRMLSGQEQCEAELAEVIGETLAAGGCEFPELIGEFSPVVELSQPIYMAYFYEQGCTECDLVERLIELIQEKYALVEVRSFDIAELDAKLLNEALCAARDVPVDRRLLTPSVVLGERVLIKDDVTLSNIETALASQAPALNVPPWDVPAKALRDAESRVLGRFRQFRVALIAGAGLLDGLNPCAFATLIFFISYLTMIGRRGRAVLAVGGAFAFSVFLTYLLVGVGFFEFLRRIQRVLEVVAIAFYALTAAAAVVLGILSFRDFLLCRRGQLTEIALQLPKRLKLHIHRTISSKSRTRHFVVGAAVAGVLVSLLELACTGQVYLPTIVLVLQVTGIWSRAMLLLILYNVMFVVPLIVVFVVAYFGVSSKGLTVFFQRRAAAVKLATSCLFFAMAAFLITELLRTHIL